MRRSVPLLLVFIPLAASTAARGKAPWRWKVKEPRVYQLESRITPPEALVLAGSGDDAVLAVGLRTTAVVRCAARPLLDANGFLVRCDVLDAQLEVQLPEPRDGDGAMAAVERWTGWLEASSIELELFDDGQLRSSRLLVPDAQAVPDAVRPTLEGIADRLVAPFDVQLPAISDLRPQVTWTGPAERGLALPGGTGAVAEGQVAHRVVGVAEAVTEVRSEGAGVLVDPRGGARDRSWEAVYAGGFRYDSDRRGLVFREIDVQATPVAATAAQGVGPYRYLARLEQLAEGAAVPQLPASRVVAPAE